MGHFSFRIMDQEDAGTSSQWHYEGPYSFYDMDRDPEDLEELLSPEGRGDSYFSTCNDHGELVGFFCFKQDGPALELGLGLRPDLTGKGMGPDFLLAGLEFARSRFAPASFRLAVATFNQRAIRVYEKAGFRPVKVFMNQTNGGEYEFLQMTREA